jgi:heme-degrading monooxygenase HmoA
MGQITKTTIPTTFIEKDGPYVTVITFFHVDEVHQSLVVDEATRAAQAMSVEAGCVALNVLRSTDGSRVVTYGQWLCLESRRAAETNPGASGAIAAAKAVTLNDARPRDYTVVYADDRSPAGVSTISPSYQGAIFINEITTSPSTQSRLLELVIANNEIQSKGTPGYRSANFHRSSDGLRAVNYSLWDSEEHCIEAISAMADMDENLEETVEIASPDFRFFTLEYSNHR